MNGRLFHSPGSSPQAIPARSRRRLSVVSLYAGYPLLLLAFWLGTGHRASWAVASLLLAGAVALTVSGWIAVYSAGRLIADDVEGAIDERQLALRNFAYLNAYRASGAGVILSSFYLGIAVDQGWPRPVTFNEWQAVAWGVFVVFVTLPSAILAWSQPDSP